MSESSERGKSFEMKVSKMIRLKGDKQAQRNKGSHANFHRRSDIFTNLPIHIEAKDHETLRPKEWFRQAEEASFGKTPVVAFQMDTEVMCLLKLDDLLNLFVEIADQKLEIEDLKTPVEPSSVFKTIMHKGEELSFHGVPIITKEIEGYPVPKDMMIMFNEHNLKREVKLCPAGHIVDQWGYCLTKGCKFNRTYRPPKSKEKK